MSSSILTLLFIAVLSDIANGQDQPVTQIQLDTTYRLSFWLSGSDTLVFRVEVQNLGWVGLGFGPADEMAGADLVIGGVRNGSAYLYDRHGTGHIIPPLDDQQNYELVNGTENNTHTILTFKRKLDTGDSNDWKFDSRPVHILWAYNPVDATDGNTLTRHLNRGTSSAPVVIPSPIVNSSMAVTSASIPASTGSTPAASSSASVKPMSTSDFNYSIILDPAGSFRLYWKYDDDVITFQLQAQTKGWAGLGFSPTGGMGGADIAVFWIDGDGKGYVSDRYGTQNGFPPEDAHQDYTLIGAGRSDDGRLVVTFSRKRNTCDVQDFALTDDTTRVIYASNDQVPANKDSIMKHTTRGTKSVHFFDKQLGTGDGLPPMDKTAKPLDFRVDHVHVPLVDTTYWCEVVPLPKLINKVHVIKTEPLIDPQNVDVVHHIVTYVCSQNLSAYVGHGRSCFEEDGETENPDFTKCKVQVLAVWAVGGQGTTFPDNVGYPLFSNESTDMYVMMEMHYDNSEFKKDKIDNSGMRLWITETLRPIDSGQALVGLPVGSDEQIIPPGVTNFTSYGYCSAICTERFPKEGITVLGGLLHTHLAGRKVRLQHFRNGKQLSPVIADEHYDFNYQDGRRLSTPIKLFPGDELVTECVYDTIDRKNTTFSGHGTHEEMCVIFFDYYPRLPRGFMCMSTLDKRAFYPKALGINLAPMNISNPTDLEVQLLNNSTKSLRHYLTQDYKFDWTQTKIDQFQKALRDAKYTIICPLPDTNSSGNATSNVTSGMITQQIGYPNVSEWLVIPDVCKKQGDSPASTGTTIASTMGTAGTNVTTGTTVRATSAPVTEKKNGAEGYKMFKPIFYLIFTIALFVF